MEIGSSGPDASIGAKTSDSNCSDQKFTTRTAGDARHQELALVYGPSENPETAILDAATPEVANMTEFTEGFWERDANDFAVPPEPNKKEPSTRWL